MNDSATAPAITSTLSTKNIITELWLRAADSLTQAELEWFAHSSDYNYNEMQARCLCSVIERIGCLMAGDGQVGSNRTGNFQGADDVPDLLFNIAHQVETLAGLMTVSSGAYDRLAKPDSYARLKAHQ